jgi:hypothetical protein
MESHFFVVRFFIMMGCILGSILILAHIADTFIIY